MLQEIERRAIPAHPTPPSCFYFSPTASIVTLSRAVLSLKMHEKTRGQKFDPDLLRSDCRLQLIMLC